MNNVNYKTNSSVKIFKLGHTYIVLYGFHSLLVWWTFPAQVSEAYYSIFNVLLNVHLSIILFNDQLDAQYFLYMFISILYMFWACKCSSWDSIVSIRYLVHALWKQV